MTIPVTTNRVDYVASDGQTTFAYPFRLYASTDIRVYVGGALKTPIVHYFVTGIGFPDGGNVILTSGVPAGTEVVLGCVLPLSQLTSYPESGPFPALAHETALDRIIKIAQQLQEQHFRTPALAPYSHITGISLPEPNTLPLQNGGKRAIVWNDAGTNLTLTELTMEFGLGEVIPIVANLAALPAPGVDGRLRYVIDPAVLVIDQGSGWHYITTVDEMVIPNVLRANLPDPTLVTGRARYITDAPQALAISDGTTWREFPVGGVPLVSASDAASLPDPNPAGQVYRLTDVYRGLVLSDGSNWVGINGPFYRPEYQGGANMGASLAALIAEMPSTGGTIDARGYIGSQTATATITINKPITLLLGEVVLTSSASPMFSVTASGPVAIIGVNRGSSILRSTSPTQVVIQVNTASPIRVEQLTIDDSGSTRTGGAGIQLLGTGGVPNGFSRFSALHIADQWRGLDASNAYAWVLRDSFIVGSWNTGVWVSCVDSVDTGDSTITATVFDSTHNDVNVSAIYQVSSGGLRVMNNKILGHYYGYAMDVLGTTSILLIEGNSIENQAGACVSMGRSGGTATFSRVLIVGNQMAISTGYAILITHAAITDGVIGNNVVSVLSPFSCVALSDASKWFVTNNIFSGDGGSSAGINMSSGSTYIDTGLNAYDTIGVPVVLNTTQPSVAFAAQPMTTTQQDAGGINPSLRPIIFNSTTGKFRGWTGSAWVDFH